MIECSIFDTKLTRVLALTKLEYDFSINNRIRLEKLPRSGPISSNRSQLSFEKLIIFLVEQLKAVKAMIQCRNELLLTMTPDENVSFILREASTSSF